MFEARAPQPFQAASSAGSAMAGHERHMLGIVRASPRAELPSGRPLMNSASAFFCASLSPSDCARMDPDVSAS